MTRYYKLIVAGPIQILPSTLVKVVDIEITQDEIEEEMEESCCSEAEALDLLLQDSIDEWEQGLCKAIILDVETFNKLKESI